MAVTRLTMVLPYFYATCEHCQGHIVFPTPNPQESEDRLRHLAKSTWQIYFQCMNCGRVSRCTTATLHLDRAQRHTPDQVLPSFPGPSGFYWRLEHKCGYSNCGLLHVLFLRTWKYQTERQLCRTVATIAKRGPVTRCPHGHEFEPTFEFVRAIEVFSIP
jgi:hypothetical protein